ncbi:MAG: hypothetical protein EPO68_10520 [Planctomycetota bacterium]|nr:MAG: hypothetical protein EPO68_10520 [Planctomycetota bacterium]
MKLPLLLGLGALALLAVPLLAFAGDEPAKGKPVPGEPMPAFTAKVVQTIDSSKPAGVTVYMTLGVNCPATPQYTERVKDIERAYLSKGVSFVYIYPNKTESSEAKAAFHLKSGYVGGMIDDEGARITKLLAGKKTSEAFVVGKDGKIAYRGGIDDSLKAAEVKQKYLATALDELLAGKPVTTQSTQPFG